jgi:hypothetical protein
MHFEIKWILEASFSEEFEECVLETSREINVEFPYRYREEDINVYRISLQESKSMPPNI